MIAITAATIVKALAVKTGYEDSAVASFAYTVNTHILSYDLNGGTGTKPGDVTLEKGEDTTVAAKPGDIEKTGDTFAGWNTEAGGDGTGFAAGSGIFTMGTTDVTLFARWAADEYTITFHSMGGSNVSPIIQEYGTQIVNSPVSTKSGYKLDDWYMESGCENQVHFPYTITGDKTLYAKWSLNVVTDLNRDTDYDGKPDINIDTNGDGVADLNIDTDGDGISDVNIDTNGDGTPDLNVDTDNDGEPDLNIDSNHDGLADTNVDTNHDGTADTNVDTDGDGEADSNLDSNIGAVDADTDGDGTPDMNLDTDDDGTPDMNIDTDGDGIPDVNVDTDGNGTPDTNLDTDGDGKADMNLDTNGDGTADTNVDTDEDGKPGHEHRHHRRRCARHECGYGRRWNTGYQHRLLHPVL